MQLTIKIPDGLPNSKLLRLMDEINALFAAEDIFCEIQENTPKDSEDIDPWDALDVEALAVDTGIEDFAENHDHYLYGLPKRS